MSIVNQVRELFTETELFLYGSRSVKGIIPFPDSDYDFAVQHSDEFVQQALSKGFILEELRDAYRDNLTVCLLWKNLPIKNEVVKVQIVTKRCLPFFKLLWNNISFHYYSSYMWKQKLSPYDNRPEKKLFIKDTINQLARSQAKLLLTVDKLSDNIVLSEKLGIDMSVVESLAGTSVEELLEFEEAENQRVVTLNQALEEVTGYETAREIYNKDLEFAQQVYAYLGHLLQDRQAREQYSAQHNSNYL